MNLNSKVSGHLLKRRTLDWLESLQADGAVGLPMSSSSPYRTVEATCFAIFAYELFGALDSVPLERREQWRQFIHVCQDASTGLFHDPLLRREDLLSPVYNWKFVTWQTTFFAINALNALGAEPQHRLCFIDPFRTPETVVERLERGNWSEPWGESNRVMFLTYFLIEEGAVDLARQVLDWLDAHQDPATGFWGIKDGADLLNAMAGAFHFYFFYFYLGRPVHYANAIIDHTLALQQPDGLYSPWGGGGACLDLDAVDTLVKFSLLTDYRAEDIKASLSRSFTAILANQRSNGAFCEALRPPSHKSLKRRVGEALKLDKLLRKPYLPVVDISRFAGWNKMEFRVDEGDLWSTWFRLLALALISDRYPGEFIDEIPWVFRRSSGLGWHDAQRLQQIREKFYS